MRRFSVFLVALLLAAVPAFAERHSFAAKDADIENTTATKQLHQSFGGGFQGDTHWDIEFDADGGPSGTASETAFFHGPYPKNGSPNYQVRFTHLEYQEVTPGKQICIEVIACAGSDGGLAFSCTNAGTHAQIVYSVVSPGGAFAGTHSTAYSTTDTIMRADSGQPACTAITCADAPVRYKVRQNNSISGCTNPTTLPWRVNWMITETQ